MNIDDIKSIIENSLRDLMLNDKRLIKKRVKEECINHCLAKYIENHLNNLLTSIAYKPRINYSVDLEYNKNYSEPKYIIDNNDNRKAIRPDIITHVRDSNNFNLIAFEIKKDYTDKNDLLKIERLMANPYNYKYGCLISYLPEKKYVITKMLFKQREKICRSVLKFDKESKIFT